MIVDIATTSWLWKFILAHKLTAVGAGAYSSSWMFSAYASQLKEPVPMGNRLYAWWYAVVHLAAANIDRLMRNR